MARSKPSRRQLSVRSQHQSRSRRITPRALAQKHSSNRVPGLMEEIQVLWVVNKSTIWWRAEVTEFISTTDEPTGEAPQGSTSAIIRYVARRGYVAQDFKVSFIHTVSGNNKLIHLSPSSPGYVTWKFPEDKVNVSPSVLSLMGTKGSSAQRKAHGTHGTHVNPVPLHGDSLGSTPTSVSPTSASNANASNANATVTATNSIENADLSSSGTAPQR